MTVSKIHPSKLLTLQASKILLPTVIMTCVKEHENGCISLHHRVVKQSLLCKKIAEKRKLQTLS